jgi:hypothetical protein
MALASVSGALFCEIDAALLLLAAVCKKATDYLIFTLAAKLK